MGREDYELGRMKGEGAGSYGQNQHAKHSDHNERHVATGGNGIVHCHTEELISGGHHHSAASRRRYWPAPSGYEENRAAAYYSAAACAEFEPI